MPIPILASRAIVRPIAPWTPARITGIWAWWSAAKLTGLADADPVSTFTDSSGNARDATAAGGARALYKTNIINGRPALLFDGTANIYSFPAFSSANATAIAVGFSTHAVASFWLGKNGSGQHHLYSYDGINEVQTDVGTGVIATKAGTIPSTWHAAEHRKRSSNNTYEARYNGSAGTTQSSTNNSEFDRMGYPVVPYYIKGYLTDIILAAVDISAGDTTSAYHYIEDNFLIDMP